MVIRNKAHPAATGRSSEEALLAAAREMVLAVGVRRTTLSDVARRAGLSRMTVYRRFPDTAALVAALMTREFARVFDRVLEQAGKLSSARQRLVYAATAGVEALADHELFHRVLEVDPELLLPYLFERLGSTQLAALSMMRDLIKAGQEDGSIRRGSPKLLSLSLLLAIQSFVLSRRIIPFPGASRAALLAELRTLVDRYLAP